MPSAIAERRVPLLVLGLGNLLCGDDGLGVEAVRVLAEEYELPDGVVVLDGGTLGLSLLPHVLDARNVILVDAIRGAGPPGSLVRIEGEDVAPAVAGRLSPHQVGVADLLDGARLLDRYPERLVLHGAVPRSLELGLGLSPAVAASLPELLRRVVAEAESLGFELARRSTRDAASRPDRAAAALGVGV
jgi:hydrogenase maturation protease